MLTILAIVYSIAALLLVIVVMIQAGKGAGMGIFGGGGSNTTFGTQGGDILTRITTVLGILFFGIAMVIAFMMSRQRLVSDQLLRGSGEKRKSAPMIIAPGDKEALSNARARQGAGMKDKTQETNQTDKSK